MAEYIEREKLITELNNIAIDLLKDNSIQCSLAAGTVVDIKDNVVAKQPAVDVAEILRNKLPLGKIQTALEHCKRPAGKHECDKCPYVSSRGLCTTNLLNDTIALISHLQAENERLQEKAEKVFVATINKFLSIKDHYVIVEGEFLECEMMDELENLFDFEFCEFNEDYKEKLDNLLKRLEGANDG